MARQPTVSERVAVYDAVRAVNDVHHYGQAVAAEELIVHRQQDEHRFAAMVVALAAMVDPNRRVTDLLAWQTRDGG